jgi:hypothetical protein
MYDEDDDVIPPFDRSRIVKSSLTKVGDSVLVNLEILDCDDKCSKRLISFDTHLIDDGILDPDFEEAIKRSVDWNQMRSLGL